MIGTEITDAILNTINNVLQKSKEIGVQTLTAKINNCIFTVNNETKHPYVRFDTENTDALPSFLLITSDEISYVPKDSTSQIFSEKELPEKYKDDFQKLKNTLFKTLYPIETKDNND